MQVDNIGYSQEWAKSHTAEQFVKEFSNAHYVGDKEQVAKLTLAHKILNAPVEAKPAEKPKVELADASKPWTQATE